MNLQNVVAAFLDHRQRRRRSTGTIEQYQYHLEEIWLWWRGQQHLSDDLASVSVDELSRFFTYLTTERWNRLTGRAGMSPATVDAAWRILRSLWIFAARRKWLTPEQTEFFSDDELLPRPALDLRVRPVVEEDDFERMVYAATTEFEGVERERNRALLLILAETGMRVSEVARLQVDDLRLNERCGKVIGKGNKEGWVFWHIRGNRALREYLKVRPGGSEGAVFRRLNGRDMTSDDVRKVIKQIALVAGVELPKGAPVHALRHRFAHRGLAAGLDISQVGQLMRHRSTQTTLRYLLENRENLRKIRDQMNE